MMVAPAPRPLPVPHTTTAPPPPPPSQPPVTAVMPAVPQSVEQTRSHPPPAYNQTNNNLVNINHQNAVIGHQHLPPSAYVTAGNTTLPPSPASTTSAFLLGMHNYEALDNIDLPEFVQEHQATLTFPEKLMLMLTYVEKDCAADSKKKPDESCVYWILEGRAFIIRNKDELVKTLLPMFFRQAKFPSFTRKLYRWGFRQISVAPDRISNRREMIFGHEFFQRDNKPLMSRMRSVTAAGTRRAMAAMAVKQHKSVGPHTDKATLEPKAPVAPAPGMMFYPVVLPTAPASYAVPTTAKQHQPPTGAPLQSAPMGPPPNGCVQIVSAPGQHQQHVNGMLTTGNSSMTPMGAPTLQQALTLSHQQRSVVMAGPPNMAQQQHSYSAPAPAASSQQQQQQSAPSPAMPPHLVPPPGPYGQFSQPQHTTGNPLVQTLVAAPHPQQHPQRVTVGGQQHPQAPTGAPVPDANTYMRAAIDMLLRYAS
eukprot:CAMPEP_0202441758 /NCGR_PEP_ID=MMETSP1360-20130828/1260_1 /ASSEMBLY_ACC=CAM_ASM_000848 /TAXON_ID=515479 /ORGANISM="Licmophora paradoxa, Strain CCMP2313" /LENGTH=477 /DNA_ID=CAMNT_0049056881 /DNA_START=114 /DNA_END=1547 /DNA_ORIENTATION=-